MNNDTTAFAAIDDELSAMNLSEEDAILKGMDDLDKQKPVEVKEATSAPKDSTDKKPEDALPVYDKSELLEVFDELLFKGEYREIIKVGKNYTIKWRTRTAGESNDITRKVDALDLKTYMAVQNFTQVMTLTFAIVEINNKSFLDMKFEDRYKLVKSLPEGLMVLLSSKLFEFDRKVMLALKEGNENF